MKRDGQYVALADRHRMLADAAEDLHAGTVLGDPWGADEHRVHRAAVDPVQIDIGLERPDLAAERVAARRDVEDAEMLAVEHDHAGARAEDRDAAGGQRAQR